MPYVWRRARCASPACHHICCSPCNHTDLPYTKTEFAADAGLANMSGGRAPRLEKTAELTLPLTTHANKTRNSVHRPRFCHENKQQ